MVIVPLSHPLPRLTDSTLTKGPRWMEQLLEVPEPRTDLGTAEPRAERKLGPITCTSKNPWAGITQCSVMTSVFKVLIPPMFREPASGCVYLSTRLAGGLPGNHGQSTRTVRVPYLSQQDENRRRAHLCLFLRMVSPRGRFLPFAACWKCRSRTEQASYFHQRSVRHNPNFFICS